MFLALAQQRWGASTLGVAPEFPVNGPDDANQKLRSRQSASHPILLLMNQSAFQENTTRPGDTLCDISQTFSPHLNHHRDTRTSRHRFSLSGSCWHIKAPYENRKFAGPSTLLLISVQFLDIPASCARAFVKLRYHFLRLQTPLGKFNFAQVARHRLRFAKRPTLL